MERDSDLAAPVMKAEISQDKQTAKRGPDIMIKRVLLTGISGVGKSTLICELAARGYKAIDADTDEWSKWSDDIHTPAELGSPVKPDRDWVWREDRMQSLLATTDTELLFVSGCAENMGQFFPQFDRIILLSASPDVIVERLATRTSNCYGKQPDEVRRILGQIDTIEPLLRKRACLEINTGVSIDQVVDTILKFVKTQH